MVTSSPRTLLQFSMRKRTNSHTWRKRKIRYYYYYYNYYILNFLLALLQWLTGRFRVVQVRFCSSQHRGKTNTVAFTECLQIHNLYSEKMPKIFCFRPGQCPNNNMWQLWLAGNSRNIRSPSRLSLITTAFVFTRDPRALHSQEEWHEDDEFQPQSPFVGSFFCFFFPPSHRVLGFATGRRRPCLTAFMDVDGTFSQNKSQSLAGDAAFQRQTRKMDQTHEVTGFVFVPVCEQFP